MSSAHLGLLLMTTVITHRISEALEDKSIATAVALGISKAFDKVGDATLIPQLWRCSSIINSFLLASTDVFSSALIFFFYNLTICLRTF